MRIALGADHGGYGLKQQLGPHLEGLGHQVVDIGTSSNEAVDYPVYARAVAVEVASRRCDRGIMIDGAGIGSAMVANKVPGVRAALAYDLSSARNSREHNDANVLTLGAGLIGPHLAEQIVTLWLEVSCTEPRHQRRVAQIEQASSTGSSGAIPTLSEDDLARIAEELRKITAKGELSVQSVEAGPEPPVGPTAAVLVQSPTAGRRLDDSAKIASTIDHTLLRPEAKAEEIKKLCAEAREHHFAAVCVQPVWTRLVAQELRGSSIEVCAVVGFPLGTTASENKALEARRAIREGATEIDMVIHVGALKMGEDEEVLRDIRAVVEACRDGSAICKVIIEAARLNDEQKRRACRIARRARAHFVKTSTGFGPGGATTHDVALMSEEVRDAGIGVKAAGGIRTLADARAMIAAGATRIGTSSGVAIVQEARGIARGV